MVLEVWDDTSSVAFDRHLWSELWSLRFLLTPTALIMGLAGRGCHELRDNLVLFAEA